MRVTIEHHDDDNVCWELVADVVSEAPTWDHPGGYEEDVIGWRRAGASVDEGGVPADVRVSLLERVGQAAVDRARDLRDRDVDAELERLEEWREWRQSDYWMGYGL